MDKLVYLYYPILIGILFWGAKRSKKGEWNEEFMSIPQVKALQGFLAILIMFHHLGQRTSAHWLADEYWRPGLSIFVPFGYYFVGIFIFCSGYGLYKSYHTKENYLKGFFGKRILPLIVAFYSTGILFLVFRLILGEKMSVAQFLIYLLGLQLSNPNTWFVIAMPILYLGFYLAFRFCKQEKVAIIATGIWVFAYTLIGTCIDHNRWWFRGEWWYNCVHFFLLGILFCKYEQNILAHLKKHYRLYLIFAFIGVLVLYWQAEFAQGFFSYYGENWGAPDKVLRRWFCLIAQMLASGSFVFFVFLVGMKMKIGNPILEFMGKITLEFYLTHSLFVELFAFSFDNLPYSLFYIENVALYVLVVSLLSVPATLLFKCWTDRLLTILRRMRMR